MTLTMPDRQTLPDGPLRQLIQAVHDIYNEAGRPGLRKISRTIRERDDLNDTVSHATVSAILRGDGLPGWLKLECVVRQLAEWAVSRPDPNVVARRFHNLWLAADDAARATVVTSENDLSLTTVDTGLTTVDMAAPVIERSVTSDGLVSNAPTRNDAFVGRGALLTEMRRRVDAALRRPLVLHGPPGVGKTELACEFAHRYADHYDIVWWVPASDPALTRAALAALGERFDLPRSKDLNQIVRATLDALESTDLRWLLVFDDADDPEALRQMLPAGGDVVVTTGVPGWSRVGTTLRVGVLDRPESVDLLRRQGRAASPDEADLLAAQLGDLPLTLDQATALQQATGMAVADYRRLFGGHLADLSAAPAQPGHPVAVVAAVRLALQSLRARAPVAAELFELFAFLGSEPLPVSLLRMDGKADIPSSLGRALQRFDLVERVVGRLVSFGVARLEPRNKTIRVHGLVRSVLRDELGRERADEVRAVTHRLLAAANPGEPEDPRNWSIHADLGPHLIAGEAVRSGEAAVRRAIVDQIIYLERRGEYTQSRRLGELAIGAWDRGVRAGDLGPDDELTFEAVGETAKAMRALGSYDAARDATRAAFDRLRGCPAYGGDHPSTLRMAGLVSLCLRTTGAYSEALRIDRDVVARRKHREGEHSEPTSAALEGLAVSLRMNGLFAEAYKVDLQVRERLTGLLGKEHPRTLLVGASLARDLYGLGRYREGLELVEGLVPMLIRLHGSSHEDVLRSNRMRVIGLRRTGRHAEALQVAEAHLWSANRLFEETQPDKLLSMLTHTNTLLVCGRVTKDDATRMHAGFRRAFEGRNPVCLAAAVNYAAVLRALGDRREAYDIAKVTLQELEDVLGEDHPYTLAASNGLAISMRLDHEPESALTLAQALVDRARRALGPEHPDTLVFEANLGRDLASIDGLRTNALRDRAVEALRTGGLHVPDDTWLECAIEPPEF